MAEGAAPRLGAETAERALLARLQAPPDASSAPFNYLLRRAATPGRGSARSLLRRPPASPPHPP